MDRVAVFVLDGEDFFAPVTDGEGADLTKVGRGFFGEDGRFDAVDIIEGDGGGASVGVGDAGDFGVVAVDFGGDG